MFFSVNLQLRHEMEKANFDSEASILSMEAMEDIVRRRVPPVFQPR